MYIVLIILAILVVVVISIYNNLIKAKISAETAWSDIDVQLQRRFDLIPNLVETVKGYMTHEQETLSKVTELRSSWATAGTIKEKAELDTQLTGALKTIMAVSENYPDLKADVNFLNLSEELRNTENKISFSRQFYNQSVQRLNVSLQTFPSNIVASIFSIKADNLQLFEVENDEMRQNIKVDFGNK